MIESPAVARSGVAPATSLSNKILNQHLGRLALVYVRQSSTKQVEQNTASTEMQYKLVDGAAALGWPHERIDVIDEDLGVSRRSIEGRAGFLGWRGVRSEWHFRCSHKDLRLAADLRGSCKIEVSRCVRHDYEQPWQCDSDQTPARSRGAAELFSPLSRQAVQLY